MATQQLNYISGIPAIQLERNRRGGLIAMGVVLIIFGVISGCMASLMPISIYMMRFAARKAASSGASAAMPQMPMVRVMVQAMAIYFAVAVAFVWTGVGSCRCRRWVRPVVLSVAWPGLVMGVLGMAALMVLLADVKASSTFAATPGATTAPAIGTAAQTAMMAGVYGVALVFYVIFPGVYALFYQSANVRDTLAAYDPNPSWTDRPLPVIAVSVDLFLLGVATLWQLTAMTAAFFGTYLQGAAAAAVTVATAALCLLAAVLCYRRSPIGWAMAVGLVVLLAASWSISSLLGDPAVLLAENGVDPRTVNVFKHRGYLALSSALLAAIALAFLFKTRKSFTPAAPPDAAAPHEPERSLAP